MDRNVKNTMYLMDRSLAAVYKPQAVIVSGFWRSGTTWLQQLLAQTLQAKTIFEPLDQDSRIPFLRSRDALYRGYIPSSGKELSEADWRSLDLSFRGVSPHRAGFSYLCRDGLGEVFRRNLVVKFVRAQFILQDLVMRYNPDATIHISRHPMPVVQSMLRSGWNWSFEDIQFEDFYGGRNDSLPKSVEKLLGTRFRGTHQKIAALWAITEQASLALRSIVPCRYEELVTDSELAFAKLLDDAQLTMKNAPDFERDSPVTIAQRSGITAEERLTSWRRDMPAEMQADVRVVIREFWPSIDEHWDLT